MSTNFYADKVLCTCCGNTERIHLGKRGYGWEFTFQGSNTVRDFEDWKQLVQSADSISDGYGSRYTPDEMIDIARMQNGAGYLHHDLGDRMWRDDNGYFFSSREFS